MSQSESIWAKVQLKSPPEKFYGFFRNHLGDLVNIFPDHFKGFQLVQGESLSIGSVTTQFKFHDGSQLQTEKYLMRFDDVKKHIIFEAVEGEMLKHYKLMRFKLEAVNGGLSKAGGNFAKWILEFEKANENVPSPENYLDLTVKVTKVVDAYFSKN